MVAILALTAGCGGSDGSSPPPQGGIAIGTLAYIDTTCEQTGGVLRGSQAVRVIQGESERSVLDLDFEELPASATCAILGTQRSAGSGSIGAVQRFGVTPDGERLVFEVTDDFVDPGLQLLRRNSLAPEQEGFFSVRPDGSAMKPLGPASRSPQFFRNEFSAPDLAFSADGTKTLITDLGPGPDGEEVPQIFLFDVETGRRTQLTHMPRASYLCCSSFIGDDRIGFISFDDAGRRNLFTARLDGSELTLIPPLVASGGILVPGFQITGGGLVAVDAMVPVQPVNTQTPGESREIFVGDGRNTVQVTNFHRNDTALTGALVGIDDERIFVTASADPFGENPSELCQIFSTDPFGGDLRQLTFFSQASRSLGGCAAGLGDGCGIGFAFASGLDRRTGALIFDSTCNPFGTTPVGRQVYIIRPDGSGLRELTHTSGLVVGGDGSTRTELPQFWAYGPHR